MSAYRALAPAKVNLGLFVGPRRAGDARHELVTVMQSISLADELTLEPAPGASDDEVRCPALPGPQSANLATAALRAFRSATGWQAGPLRLTISKRIPIAAGLGGGSADAAATLRLLRHASGLGDDELLGELAGRLGADVPAQVSPGRWLATGAGERLYRLADPNPPLALVLLPAAEGLETSAVYAQLDRLGAGRTMQALEQRRHALLDALDGGAALAGSGELLDNDLEAAAISLCPAIADTLAEALRAGAERAIVSGSGPTVLAVLAAEGRGRRADAPGGAADGGEGVRIGIPAGLVGRRPAALGVQTVDGAFARPVSLPGYDP